MTLDNFSEETILVALPLPPPDTNDTDFQSASDFISHAVVNVLITIFACTIILGTVIGNLMVIAAVLLERRLRKVGNTFIINLAVSDILVGTLVTPMALAYQLMGKWGFGRELCDFWISMDVICCTASIANLCVISYDRFNAITQPLRYARKRTVKRAMILILSVWAYSVLIAVPPFLGWREDVSTLDPENCKITQDKGYTLYSTIGAFYLPLTFMLSSYIRIYRVTSRRGRQWRRGPGSSKMITERHSDIEAAATLKLLSLKKSSNEICPTVSNEQTIQEKSSSTPESQVPPLPTYGTYGQAEDDVRPFPRHSSLSSPTTPPSRHPRSAFPKKLIRQISNLPSSDSSTTTSTSTTISSDATVDTLLDKRASIKTNILLERKDSMFKVFQDGNPNYRKSVTFLTPAPVNNDCSSDEKDVSVDEASKYTVQKNNGNRRKKKISVSQEKRAAKTLSIVMGCFIVCWLPFFLVALIEPMCSSCTVPPALVGVVLWMGYCNSALNPIIYTFFNKDFRYAFKRMIVCGQKKNATLL